MICIWHQLVLLKWWICSWSYWLSTRSSIRITFYCSCALDLPLLCLG